MVTTLTVDALDHILDVLGQERKDKWYQLTWSAEDALKACALASSVLRVRAQYQLFLFVRLSRARRAARFRETIERNPLLAANVKELLVRARTRGRLWLFKPSLTSLSSLLTLLPNLEHLILSDVKYPEFSAHGSTLTNLYSTLPSSVLGLTCVDCVFSDDAQLVDFLRAFPSTLRYLRITNPEWPWQGLVAEEQSLVPEIAPTTFTLLTAPQMAAMCPPSWPNLISPCNLTRLALTLSQKSADRWQAVLHAATNLCELHMCELRVPSDESYASLDLADLPDLCRVTACSWSRDSESWTARSADPVSPFLRILTTATSSRLKHAALDFRTFQMHRIDDTSWTNVKAGMRDVRWAHNRPSLAIGLYPVGDHDIWFDAKLRAERYGHVIALHGITGVSVDRRYPQVHGW
jgi:hypothetical protein